MHTDTTMFQFLAIWASLLLHLAVLLFPVCQYFVLRVHLSPEDVATGMQSNLSVRGGKQDCSLKVRTRGISMCWPNK